MRATQAQSRIGFAGDAFRSRNTDRRVRSVFVARLRFASVGDMHHVQYVAQPMAPVAAGRSERNNRRRRFESRGATSNDMFVHVTDDTRVDGFLMGATQAQVLKVTRTFDGVRIYRPEGTRSCSAFHESHRSRHYPR